jgi:uncharacterized protein YidB (DUF937 family)
MGGLLGQILGGMVAGNLGRRSPRGGGSMVLNGLLVALATKAVQHHMSQRREGRSFDPRQPGATGGFPPAGGGLGGALGGAMGGAASGGGGLGGGLGGGGLGGMLGGLGGAGALGALLNQLRQRGYGQQVDSWVRPGPNQPLAPNQLADALGDDTVEALTHETGMPRQALLSELSQALPEAVDEMTPEGREPSDADLQRVAGQA